MSKETCLAWRALGASAQGIERTDVAIRCWSRVLELVPDVLGDRATTDTVKTVTTGNEITGDPMPAAVQDIGDKGGVGLDVIQDDVLCRFALITFT